MPTRGEKPVGLLREAEDAQVLLLSQPLQRSNAIAGRHHTLDEQLGQRIGGRVVHLVSERDHRAEGAGGIGGQGALIRLDPRVAHRDAAGRRVLDDRAGGPLGAGERRQRHQRPVQIEDVVVGELLAVVLDEAGDAAGRRRIGDAIKGGTLVRVFAVAQVLDLGQVNSQ